MVTLQGGVDELGLIDVRHGGVDDTRQFRGSAGEIGAIGAIDHGLFGLGDGHGAVVDRVGFCAEELAGRNRHEPDFRVLDGAGPGCRLRRPRRRSRASVWSNCGTRRPTTIRHRSLRRRRRRRPADCFRPDFRPTLGRQQHVTSADKAREPALAKQIPDDFAAGLFGMQQADNVAGLDNIPSLFPKGQHDPGFSRSQRA